MFSVVYMGIVLLAFVFGKSIQYTYLFVFLHRYKGVLIAMMGSILCKVQLHFNMKELREIDDDSIDDDVSHVIIGICD